MSGTAHKKTTSFAVCALQLQVDGNDIQLTPAGAFRGIDGRPAKAPAWWINNDTAALVVETVNSRKRKYVIDYEHQTLHAARNGKPAPAAGWFDQVEWREGEGLFALNVSWTDRARALIAADEYLYISPVIVHDKATGQIVDIRMAALTNSPAIDGMDEVLAAASAFFTQSTEEDHLVKTNTLAVALAAVLGLSTDASEEDINQAVVALKAKADGADESTEKVSALTADLNTANEKLAAAGEPDPAKFVSVEVMKGMQTELAELKGELNEGKVDELVVAALNAGKLLPKQEAWARKLGAKDVAELTGFLENAQPIAALTNTQTDGKQPLDDDGNAVLSEGQLAMCTSMNIDPEDYKKELPASA